MVCYSRWEFIRGTIYVKRLRIFVSASLYAKNYKHIHVILCILVILYFFFFFSFLTIFNVTKYCVTIKSDSIFCSSQTIITINLQAPSNAFIKKFSWLLVNKWQIPKTVIFPNYIVNSHNKTILFIMQCETVLMSMTLFLCTEESRFFTGNLLQECFFSGAFCELFQHLRASIFDTQMKHINSEREKMVYNDESWRVLPAEEITKDTANSRQMKCAKFESFYPSVFEPHEIFTSSHQSSYQSTGCVHRSSRRRLVCSSHRCSMV